LGNGYPRGLDASSDLVAAAGAEGLATSSRTQLWTLSMRLRQAIRVMGHAPKPTDRAQCHREDYE
jgi:hypothetical protein